MFKNSKARDIIVLKKRVILNQNKTKRSIKKGLFQRVQVSISSKNSAVNTHLILFFYKKWQ